MGSYYTILGVGPTVGIAFGTPPSQLRSFGGLLTTLRFPHAPQ